MTNYVKGRAAEYRTMRVLEAAGYRCSRSASSKGLWDVVGLSGTDVVLCQVKAGARPSPSTYSEFVELVVPGNVRKLVHWWRPRAREPEVWTV
jgi:hypothetical protein